MFFKRSKWWMGLAGIMLLLSQFSILEGGISKNNVRIATEFQSLQAAIDDLPETGGVVLIPANTIISLRKTLLINKSNVTLKGEGRTSIIKWEGGTGSPIIRIGRIGGARYIKVEDLRLQGGMRASIGIHVGTLRNPAKSSKEYHGYMHGIEIEDVYIEDLGKNGEGIRLGNFREEFVSTAAEIKIRDVQILNPGAYGIRIVGPFACNDFIEGVNIVRARKAGIAFEGWGGGGPFVIENTVFGVNRGVEAADILVARNRAMMILIKGVFGGEGDRFLWVKDVPGGHPNITIISSYIDRNKKTGEGITWETGGSLALIGSAIVGRISIQPVSRIKRGIMRFYDVMNRYQSPGLLAVSDKVVMYSVLPAYRWGQTDNWMGIGFGNPLGQGGRHTGFYLSPGYEKAFLVNAGGISGTGQNARHLRGSVIISGNATSARVVFEKAEVDANYFPIVQVAGVSGKPALGSTRVYATDLKKTGFTIRTEAAPGIGNSVRVCWIVVR